LDAILQRRITSILKYARAGRIDLLVELYALVGSRIDAETFWQCVVDVSWELLKESLTEEELRLWEKGRFPDRKFATFLRRRHSFMPFQDDDTLESAQVPFYLAIRSKDAI